MSKIIGRVIATEKNPSTIDEFYFWTKSERILNPFDVVTVQHVQDSTSYAVIEEISHITDSSSFLTDYISNDFGELGVKANTIRVGMNYVRAKVIGNSKNIYIPLLSNQEVCFASKDQIQNALGLKKDEHSVLCGYLEMYNSSADIDTVRLPVHIDSRYLIGPEGAHLNISGISGLAAKTSYAMFLLKSVQDKSLNACLSQDFENDDDVAFVFFNVKGKDLLAIDMPNDFRDSIEKERTIRLYEELGMSPRPFKNVKYYYPNARSTEAANTYMDKDLLDDQIAQKKAFYYRYDYEFDKENLDFLFSSIEDPTQSMDSILNYVISGQGEFAGVKNWETFLSKVSDKGKAGTTGNKEISVASWRKFARIVNKALLNNGLFGDVNPQFNQIRLAESLGKIKKNEVHVIDIAKLNEDMQGLVFGQAVRAIYELQLGQLNEIDEDYVPPSKIVVFIDELNKYAASDSPKSSQVLRQILDIAERGRSLGVVLFSAEQFRSAIHPRVTGNCSSHAYGRTNAIEISKGDYKYIPTVYKNMMTRLRPGEYILQNPLFRSLLNVKFPKPIYKQFKSNK